MGPRERLNVQETLLDGFKEHANVYPVHGVEVRPLAWAALDNFFLERLARTNENNYIEYLGGYAAKLASDQARNFVHHLGKEVDFHRRKEVDAIRKITNVLGERVDGIEDSDSILDAIDREYSGEATIVDHANILARFPDIRAIQTMSCPMPLHDAALRRAEGYTATNILELRDANYFVEEKNEQLGHPIDYDSTEHIFPGRYLKRLDAVIHTPDGKAKIEAVSRHNFMRIRPGGKADAFALATVSQYLRFPRTEESNS